MTRALLSGLLLLLAIGTATAQPPAARIEALRHGINITGWFRFPTSRDPAALRHWLSDAALRDLRDAGFGFVRLAVDPALVDDPPLRAVMVDSVRRLQSAGLAVVVSLHPQGWALERSIADRAHLRQAWRTLAADLRPLPPARTFPEVLNEPVFPSDAAGWQALQHSVLATIRAALPDATVVLTGADWGSIGGLLALTPEADANVVYSFHFYDPPELTALAAYRADVDRGALARLPFPATDTGCDAAVAAAEDAPTHDLIRFYCALHWNAARIGARIAEAADWARRHHVSLMAGEFGASAALNPSARLAWLQTVTSRLSEAGIGWALWGYDDEMGLAIARPPPPQPILDRYVLAALGLAGGGIKTLPERTAGPANRR